MDKVKPFHPMVSGKKVLKKIIIFCTIRNFHYFLQKHKAKKQNLCAKPNYPFGFEEANLAKFGVGLNASSLSIQETVGDAKRLL